MYKAISQQQFVDLVEYLTTLRQKDGQAYPGCRPTLQPSPSQLSVVPLHDEAMRFDHPVWIIAKPGTTSTYLVVEQQTRRVYQLTKSPDGDRKELFADLSHEAITGKFEGVLCLAFHPDFLSNRKYYLNYHVQEDGIFSPVIVERQATQDLGRDVGGASRRLLKIPQPTVLALGWYARLWTRWLPLHRGR